MFLEIIRKDKAVRAFGSDRCGRGAVGLLMIRFHRLRVTYSPFRKVVCLFGDPYIRLVGIHRVLGNPIVDLPLFFIPESCNLNALDAVEKSLLYYLLVMVSQRKKLI